MLQVPNKSPILKAGIERRGMLVGQQLRAASTILKDRRLF
jgi:hypothetical protein